MSCLPWTLLFILSKLYCPLDVLFFQNRSAEYLCWASKIKRSFSKAAPMKKWFPEALFRIIEIDSPQPHENVCYVQTVSNYSPFQVTSWAQGGLIFRKILRTSTRIRTTQMKVETIDKKWPPAAENFAQNYATKLTPDHSTRSIVHRVVSHNHSDYSAHLHGPYRSTYADSSTGRL